MSRVQLLLVALVLATATVVGLTPATAQAQSADEVLARFDSEPTVLEVQAAAMSYAGIDADDLDSWYTRAAASNILPERLRYRFQFLDESRDLNQFTEDLNADGSILGADRRREDRGENESRHEVSVEWDLSELVFNPDTLRVAREVDRQAKMREDILTTITKLYYERRRAQVDLVLDPPGDAADRLRRELRVQELTADIDALTGAWFSARLREIGKSPY